MDFELPTETCFRNTSRNSSVEWSKQLTAPRTVTYESLSLLYNESSQDVFGEHMAFAVACSNSDSVSDSNRGFVHKLEITARPTFSQAAMQVTHEVLPNQGPCSRIIEVNKRLKVACFDNGTIIPIKNFGFKKTFNCDVRAGLKHHPSAICAISADISSDRLATGCNAGEIALYQIAREEIKFLSRSRVASSAITGLAYTKPLVDNDQMSNDSEGSNTESLIYSTQSGAIGTIDSRCGYGASLHSKNSPISDPLFNISSLEVINSSGRQLIFLGGVQGQLVSIDQRFPYQYLHESKSAKNGSIKALRGVSVLDGHQTRTFLAHTNESSSIKVLDLDTMQPHPGWICDRQPNETQLDICQVGERLITCGDRASIGCWTWDDKVEEQKKSKFG